VSTDKELFKRISKSDEQAFTELYLRYSRVLKPHIARLLESELWAEEINQDVFTKLWQARETLIHVTHPPAYLFRMASNRTLDFIKQRSTEIQREYALAHSQNWAANSTEETFDARKSEELLKEAVRILSPQKQIIFRLRHEEGKSYEEIADNLRISKNTVRNHLTETLSLVRKYLLRNGVFFLFFFLGK
jgi:RNA polymerase sigma-70 factor (family 1)